MPGQDSARGSASRIVRERGLLLQRLSTDTLPARDQYAFWKEAVCALFVGLDCERRSQGAFHAAVTERVAELGGRDRVSLVDVASEAQTVTRSPTRIRRETEPWLLLSMQIDGPATLRQGGSVAAMRAGDMVLFDSTRPYRFGFDRPFRSLVVKIPHSRIAPRLPRAEAWMGRTLAADTPLGSVLAAHLGALPAAVERVDPEARPALLERTIDLIALAFLEADRRDRGRGTTLQSALVLRARHFIEARLSDPGLSPAAVAARLGISVNYLHRLFATADTSVGAHIRRRRLERCRADLADPLRAGEHVTEIALRWGFNDMPHFSRIFRAEFGMSPREFRAGAQLRDD